MKKTLLSIFLTLLLVSTLYLPNTFAQDSPQWHLPEGATARLGKGVIREVKYSPDGTKLAVASGIGIWIYDAQTGEELDLLTGHTGGSEACRSVRMVGRSPVGVGTLLSVYGKCQRGGTYAPSQGIRVGSPACRSVLMVGRSPVGVMTILSVYGKCQRGGTYAPSLGIRVRS